MQTRSQIRFCSVGDGQRIAFTVQGSGPVVVLGPWMVSHLERDTEEPKLRAFYERLAARYTLVRYDHTGVGLSDRSRTDFSFEREVTELSTVIDQVTDDQIALIAGSFSGPVATAYAARHPERVARLVLYGTFAFGEQIAPAPVQQALAGLVRAHWRLGAKTLTGILASGVSDDEGRRFTRSQLAAASAETSADLLSLFYGMDVREEARRVQSPTLVIHRSQDRAIPLDAGRDVAARIPGASMVTLDGYAHLPWFEGNGVLDAALEFLSPDGVIEPARSAADDAELIRSGDVWAIGWGGSRQHLKHAKGLADIATLVQNPGTGITALTLAEGVPQASLAITQQPLLDEQARREFRSRLRDIDVELGEAEAHGDLSRLDKLSTERQALLSELSSAAGLGMRRRVFPNDAERARKAVTARLRDAIARVRNVHPELGEHLDGSIITGLTCVYKPERPIRWRT
ncbi:MAG TPA: alpha/beta hydrolase [Polyangiaceae bacterium]|nr:alpha/beta hydrolase [Polyangiaceae bacterium]